MPNRICKRSARTVFAGAVTAAVVAIMLAGPAHASIIDNDWYTTDAGAGLDWADVTLTAGLSYNEVHNGAAHAEYAPGGWINQGWRFATHGEVLNLWAVLFGAPVQSSGVTHTGLQPVVGAVVGNTLQGTAGTLAWSGTYGYITEDFNTFYTFMLGLYHQSNVGDEAYGVDPWSNLSKNHRDSRFGSWLVRDSADAVTVTEPGVMILMLSGLLLLVHARLRHSARLRPPVRPD